MSVRTLSALDRMICQPLGRILQEAFSDGQIANFAIATGNAVRWNFTDACVLGDTNGLSINYVSATNRASGSIGAVSIDLATTGNCSAAYGAKFYTAGCGSAVIGSLCAMWVYMNDIGALATVSEKHALDLNIKNTNAPALSAFMRMYNHGGTIDAALYFANNGNGVVEHLLKFNATGNCIADDASAVASNRTHKIKCKAGGTTFYLNGYAA